MTLRGTESNLTLAQETHCAHENRRGAKGLTVILVAACLYGVYGILSRYAYADGGDLLAILTARIVGLAALSTGVALLSRRRLPPRDQFLVISILGLLLSGNAVTFFLAIQYVSPGVVTIILFTYPALVTAVSTFLGWSRLSGLTGLGTGLVIAGVTTLVGLPNEGLSIIGLLLSGGTALGAAVFLLVAQVALRRGDPLGILAASGTVSSTVLICAVFLLGGPDLPERPRGLISLLSLAVITVVGHFLLLRGVALIGSSRAAMISSFEVVVAVVASSLLLAEPLTLATVFGGALVFAGAVVIPSVTARREVGTHPL